MNCIEISGTLVERKALRYTPGGIPASEACLQHASTQIENGADRLVNLEIAVLALGESARWLEAAPLGGSVKLTGFLAAKSRNSKTPVLHVNTIEILEGK